MDHEQVLAIAPDRSRARMIRNGGSGAVPVQRAARRAAAGRGSVPAASGKALS